MVPGTHILADVASIDEIAHQRLKLGRDLRAMLDREIGDAPVGVENAGLDERVGRTSLEAAGTAATAVGVERRVGLQVEIEQQGAEKKERAMSWTDQHRVLADPPESSALREVALENRAGIDVRFPADVASTLRLDPPVQRLESRHHDVVVIIAARVPRDRPRGLFASVIQGDDHRRANALEREA